MTGKLIKEIRNCKLCQEKLPLEPRPILQFQKNSSLLIIGQAPGIAAHNSQTPWDDKSGDRLRSWLGFSKEDFYDPSLVALVPMGFCYPGKGKSGDLPPLKECSITWMEQIRKYLKNIKLEIYIGKYACDYEFKKYKNLTTLIKEQFKKDDHQIVLPHPSPRNNIWLSKNPWFEEDLIPSLRKKCQASLRK